MATRPSFRPRPIDPTRPLPILRTSKDLRNADDVVVSRALPQVGTGVEAAELEERHLQQALLASVYGEDAKNSKSFDIPIPVFETVKPPLPQSKSRFLRPPDMYIMFDKSDEDLENSMVDYDGDHVDEQFVTKYNTAHKKQQIPLDMDGLERAIDALERVQGRVYSEEEDTESADRALKPDPKKAAPAVAAAAVAAAAAKKKKETSDSLLQFSQVRSELVATLPNCTDIGRREIHAHWIQRRLAHGGPFHRLYIKAPTTDDLNPAVAFRPRGREDGGGGRRMNTYDNFKRARLLRKEFDVLRNLMRSVLSRERLKAEELSLSALNTRIQCVSNGGPRLALLSRNICVAEREGYCIGDADAKIAVSCRGFGSSLPANMEAELHRVPFGPDKRQKKLKRKSAGIVASRTDAKLGGTTGTFGAEGTVVGDSSHQSGTSDGKGSRAHASILSQPNVVDSYGFDDHGNRFLKHMRYFAGGFMNYGVCPYDHRVFAAASERNTVKNLPCEPKPFTFPAANLKFARPAQICGGGGKVRPRQLSASDVTRGPSSSHIGLFGSLHPCENAAEFPKRHLGPKFGVNASKRNRRPMKVRGRLGRGGRIILDRVVFEPERGVKAASYPASVEMGGVFTAGLPLESASCAGADAIDSSLLGRIDDLALSSEDRTLVGPLLPMIEQSQGCRDTEGHIVYWPSRKSAPAKKMAGSEVAQGQLPLRSGEYLETSVANAADVEYLRNMPAYSRRLGRRVEIVDGIGSDLASPVVSKY